MCATARPGTISPRARSSAPAVRSTSPSTATPSWWCRPRPGPRYTRNGALQLSPTGALVTNVGDPVLGTGGPIQFQDTDHDISIGEDGTITVREGASATSDSTRGQLQLARFANPEALQKQGGSLFSAPGGVAPQQASLNVRVVQGAIEQSNVNPVGEMSRMIEISRTYEQISNILQLENAERTSALDKLAAVPA